MARTFIPLKFVPLVLLSAWPAGLDGGYGQEAARQVPAEVAAGAIERALVEAISRAEKSVVAIGRVRRERPGERLIPEPRPDPFGNPRLFPTPPPQPTDPDFVPHEFATGVVVDPSGLVLTVAHILGEQSDYYVTAYDHRTFRARVLAADPRSDLAVLAPEESSDVRPATGKFVPIRLGDASRLQKGQWVVALGNPYAIARDGQASASWGIVANLARKAPPAPDDSDPTGKPTLHHFGTLIQTDAKLNLGTSGGPLVNLQGEMVGLTTAIPAVVGFQESAGYAIPVDATFRRALEALKQGREVEYGFLGIQLGRAGIDQAAAEVLGARVERVLPDLPAARHGLKANDVIVSVHGTPVRDPDQLVREISKWPLESRVRLGVRRGEQTLDLEVPLTKYRVRGRKVVTNPAPAWRGMRVDYATAVYDPGSTLRAPGVALGDAVAITDVEPNSPASHAGLRPGMLVTHVERLPVRTPKEFREAVSKHAGPVLLRVAAESGQPAVHTVGPGS